MRSLKRLIRLSDFLQFVRLSFIHKLAKLDFIVYDGQRAFSGFTPKDIRSLVEKKSPFHFRTPNTAFPFFFVGRLLDVWLDKMACVTQPERKKLMSLALCSLLTSGSPVVIGSERLFGILSAVVETLNDVTRPDEENAGAFIDALIKTPDQNDDDEGETEHDVRKRESLASDVIYTVDLRQFFESQLKGLAAQLGEVKFSQVIDNVDVETLANIKEFVAL